jgi:membrane protein required for colicin V production
MTGIDFAIIGIIFISCIISVLRGFVREALSLASWVISFILAWELHSAFAGLMESTIENNNLRLIVAFFVLFVLSLVAFTLVIFFAGKLVEKTGLTGADRVIGVFFGVARGVLIVTALVALAGYTQLPQADVWKDSLLVSYFQPIAVWLIDFLPAEYTKNFMF